MRYSRSKVRSSSILRSRLVRFSSRRAHDLVAATLGLLLHGGGAGAGLPLHRLGAGPRVADHRVGAVLGLGDHLLALLAGVAHQAVAVALGAGQHLLGLRLGLVDVAVGGLGRQGQHPGRAGAVVLAGLRRDHRRRHGRRGRRLGGRGELGAAAGAGAQFVVLLDQAGELGLDDVEEGVDLVLVVTPLADRWLLEDDVVHVGRRQWHLSVTSGRTAGTGASDGGATCGTSTPNLAGRSLTTRQVPA